MQMASRGQAHRNSLAHTSHGTRRPHSSGCPLQQSATEIPRQDGQGYHGAGQLGSRQPSTEPQVHRRTEALRDGGGATPPHLFFFFFSPKNKTFTARQVRKSNNNKHAEH